MGAKQTAFVTNIQNQINLGSAIAANLQNMVTQAGNAAGNGNAPGANIQQEVQRLKPIFANLKTAISQLEAHEKKMEKKWIGKKELGTGTKNALIAAKNTYQNWEQIIGDGEGLRFNYGQH